MIDLEKHLLSEGPLKREKPSCTCQHPFEMHQGGKCARNNGGLNTCFCDSYEPMDNFRFDFPVIPLGKLEGE